MTETKKYICPECEEPAVKLARPIPATGWATVLPLALREWGHLDGEPLCPVVGDHGYEPARPVTR